MRAVSFAGLQRILKVVAMFPKGLKPSELNRLVLEDEILPTRRNSPPSPTTLYHYRNTLIRLEALKKAGSNWCVNFDEPNVLQLLSQPAPAPGDYVLSECALESFSALVFKNKQCRDLFFGFFMAGDEDSVSLSAFRENGLSVVWSRSTSPKSKEIILRNDTTGRSGYFESHVAEQAILYGLRYWARDELQLIDEYCPLANRGAVMFPLCRTLSSGMKIIPPELETAAFLLSLRNSEEWTLFSILDLIVLCCESRRRPIKELYQAIDWLFRKWPGHTVLIPTSRALAALTAVSAPRKALELRRYYRVADGPYISHIRIHRDISFDPNLLSSHHARRPAKTSAQLKPL